MEIKIVTYRRTINLGNYQSASFEASAEVGDSNPDSAAKAIVEFVKQQLHDEHGEPQD
jgi:hypothetical protein